MLLSTFTCVPVVFVGMTVSGFTGSQTWLRITGWSGLLAALGATYLLAGQIMGSTRRPDRRGRALARTPRHPQALWTTSPATTTVSATVPGIRSGATARMSRDSTTKSAALPTVSEPRSSSRKLA